MAAVTGSVGGFGETGALPRQALPELVGGTSRPATADAACPADASILPSTVSEVQVSFCGRSTTVPFGPGAQLRDLQARTASCFGLAEPFDFDLLDGAGNLLRSDEQLSGALAANARVSGSTTRVVVRARESALLDLERAHDEAGLRRWTLVQEVLTGLRAQVAQVAEGVAESSRRAAQLEERLLREQQARQSSFASQQAFVEAMSEKLAQDTQRRCHELGAHHLASFALLESRTQDKIAEQQTAVQALQGVVDNLSQELKEEASTRQQENTDFSLRVLQQVTKRFEKEGHERQAVVDDIAARLDAKMSEVKTELADHRQAARGDRDRHAQEFGMISGEMQKLDRKLSDALADFQRSIEQQRTSAEAAATEGSAEAMQLCRELENKQAAFGAAVGKVTADISSLKCELQSLIKQHEVDLRSQIAKSGEDMQRTLDSRVTQLGQQQQERDQAVEARIGHEVGIVRAECTEAVDHQRQCIDKLRDDQQSLNSDVTRQFEKVVERTDEKLGEMFQKLREEQQEINRQAQEANGARARELDADMRKASEDRAHQVKQQCEEFASRSAAEASTKAQASMEQSTQLLERSISSEIGALREQLQQEASQLKGLMDAQGKANEELRMKQQGQARATAEELKQKLQGTLDAQSQLAEALKSKQQLLQDQLEEGLQREGIKRDELTQRMCAAECDLGKVKAHLPILFAPARAFR